VLGMSTMRESLSQACSQTSPVSKTRTEVGTLARVGEWFPMNHPSAVVRNKSKYAIPWAYDKEKLIEVLRGIPNEEEPRVIRCKSERALIEVTGGWTDFACDLETPRGNTDTVYTAAFSNGDVSAVIDFQWGARMSWVQAVFDATRGVYIFQNGAFDMRVLRDHGVTFDWSRTFDTMIAGHVMDPDGFVALANLAALYLDVCGWKHKDEEDLIRYNACDAAYTYRIYVRLKELLKEYELWEYTVNRLMPVLWEVVIPLMDIGVRIDEKRRRKMLTELRAAVKSWRSRLDTHCSSLSKTTGAEIKAPLGPSGGTSPKQMTELLYKTLRLPSFTVKGKVKTDKHALKWLRPLDKTGTVALLLEKSLLKKAETNLMSTGAGSDGRVHSRFILGGDEKAEGAEQARTKSGESGPRTGRLASRKPNLQNMTKLARVIVIPSPGLLLVERDYNQIEARITQKLSGDQSLLQAINSGDVYLWTAWKMSQLSSLYPSLNGLSFQSALILFQEKHPRVLAARQEAKSVFLGWSYRMGSRTMENTYGIPKDQAEVCLMTMDETFPQVVERWEELQERAARDHYLTNVFGQKNYFWDLRKDRQKIANYDAQSTAAEILFDAMKRINRQLGGPWKTLRTSKTFSHPIGRMILTVHDQVLAEGPDVTALDAVLKQAMEVAVPPLGDTVFPTAGSWSDKSWGEMILI